MHLQQVDHPKFNGYYSLIPASAARGQPWDIVWSSADDRRAAKYGVALRHASVQIRVWHNKNLGGATVLDARVESKVIREAVQLACRAPSLYNSQPWLWVAKCDRLDLFLAPNRIQYTDRSMREAHIGCGAVLDHLRIALAAAGWEANVERFPNPNNLKHLATVEFTAMASVTEGQHRRASAILARRTDRLPFMQAHTWKSFLPVLRSRVDPDAVALDVLLDQDRPHLAELAKLTESLRLYDSFYHSERAWWTAPFEASEGIPYSSLVSAGEAERVAINRIFPFTKNAERRTTTHQDHAKVVMLSTNDDSSASALRCGEALSTVLLECTMAGLATCPVTHLTELSVSRKLLATLTNHTDFPQVLIRVGIAPSFEQLPPPTPRRPMDDVLRIED